MTGNDAYWRYSEYPHAEQIIVHISDTHLLAGDGKLYGHTDSTGHLRTALEELEQTGLRPAAFIFTGDIADRGEPDAYRKVRELVEPVAGRMGAEILWVMGNHDDRAAFRTELLDEPGYPNAVNRTVTIDGLRIITLDTTVPGFHHGQLGAFQLADLRVELSTAAPRGTIVAMHHPPLPVIMDAAAAVELINQEDLASVIAGTDVRAILAGHIHHSSFGTFAGVPVSVASATCYTQDLTVAPNTLRPQDSAQAFNLVHVFADTIVHSVVPIGKGPTMVELDEAAVAEDLRSARVRIRQN